MVSSRELDCVRMLLYLFYWWYIIHVKLGSFKFFRQSRTEFVLWLMPSEEYCHSYPEPAATVIAAAAAAHRADKIAGARCGGWSRRAREASQSYGGKPWFRLL